VLAERAEHGAELQLHRRRLLHLLEHDHAAPLVNIGELRAYFGIFQLCAVHAAYPCAEWQRVRQCNFLDGMHLKGLQFQP
jgi:hypothetical protein